MELIQVAEALEKARAKFQGLAALVTGHINGDYLINFEKLRDSLQEGNQQAMGIIENLYKENLYSPPWAC